MADAPQPAGGAWGTGPGGDQLAGLASLVAGRSAGQRTTGRNSEAQLAFASQDYLDGARALMNDARRISGQVHGINILTRPS
jgi:hypothetical protein